MNKTHEANQQLLNEAWAHIIKQGCASVLEACDVDYADASCQYRNPQGLGCAMAPVIVDYDPEMETISAADLLSQFGENLHAWALDVRPDFAGEVQRAHDNATKHATRAGFIPAFKENMQATATRYNLRCPS